jgi:hypothetical protein
MFAYYYPFRRGGEDMLYCHGGNHPIMPDAEGTIRIEGAGTYCAEHLPPPEPPAYKPTLRESRRMEFMVWLKQRGDWDDDAHAEELSDEDKARLARHVLP